jgi:hypothetical protein
MTTAELKEATLSADVTLVTARKRKALSGMQKDISVLSIWLIATLTVIMLLSASDEFAAAMVLLGQY